jgi:hypothetical protein
LLTAIQQLLSLAFDGLLWPLSNSPRLALVWCAVVLGLLAGWLMPWLTPKKLLARLAEQTKAELLAIRLFADQPGNLFRSCLRLVWLCLARIACYAPGVQLLLPFGLLVEKQLEMRFAHRALLPEGTALVKMQFAPTAWPERGTVRLSVETEGSDRTPYRKGDYELVGPMHYESEHAIYWEVKQALAFQSIPQRGAVELKFSAGEQSLRIPFFVTDNDSRVITVVEHWNSAHLAARLSASVDSSDSSSRSVSHFDSVDLVVIDYPLREFQFANMTLPWWAIFLPVFCSAAWFAAKKQTMTIRSPFSSA